MISIPRDLSIIKAMAWFLFGGVSQPVMGRAGAFIKSDFYDRLLLFYFWLRQMIIEATINNRRPLASRAPVSIDATCVPWRWLSRPISFSLKNKKKQQQKHKTKWRPTS